MSKGPQDLWDFEGEWSLHRTIEDRLSGKSGELTGKVAMKRGDVAGLIYREEGQLRYGDEPPLTASRIYHWNEGKAGRIEVLFQDGRSFHDFSLDRTMPEASHFCDPDMYYVTYDLSRWPEWSSAWRVVGPRKNYRMQSRYLRAF